jgi:hypothetical protein
MAWTITIGGDDVSAYVQYGVSMQAGLNERPGLRLQLKVRDGDSYTGPSVRDNIDVEDTPDMVFRGVVWTVRESPVVDHMHRQYDVECVGYQALADVVLFNGPIAGGSLESMLNTAVANLSPHGIQVDPAQVTGPTLETMSFNFATITQILDALAGASGYNVAWDGDYVRMEDPGTVGAPFDLTEANSTICGLEHQLSLSNYVNEVWLIFGNAERRDVTDSFTGDGSTKTFALHYTPAAAPGYVSEDAVSYPVAPLGATGYRWYYDSVNQAMVVDAGEAAPANGDAILVPFQAQFPGSYLARDAVGYAAHGPWTITVAYPDIFEWSHAAYAANWELDRRKGVVKRVKVKTFTAGLVPGMDVNITATNYGLSSTNCLITNVRARHVLQKADKEPLIEYEIEALEGNQWQQNWQEYYRKLNTGSGVGSSGSVVSGTGSVSTVTVRGAFWGGSRQFGWQTGSWEDAIDWLPIALDGTAGVPVTVRVDQRTEHSGTSVQVRIVKVSGGTVMATGAASSSTAGDTALLTFTPSTGSTDYKLQVLGSNASAQVFAIGQSL